MRHNIWTIHGDEKAGEVSLYMLEFPTGRDHNGNTVPARVLYCMESDAENLLLWPDWLQFANEVNRIFKGQAFKLETHTDPAWLDGLVVKAECACPNCGCRVMDELQWSDDDTHVGCRACGTDYYPG